MAESNYEMCLKYSLALETERLTHEGVTGSTADEIAFQNQLIADQGEALRYVIAHGLRAIVDAIESSNG